MKTTTKNDIDQMLSKAYKQINQALKNIEKAEDVAFQNHEDNLYEDLQRHNLDIAKANDALYILNCIVKHSTVEEA